MKKTIFRFLIFEIWSIMYLTFLEKLPKFHHKSPNYWVFLATRSKFVSEDSKKMKKCFAKKNVVEKCQLFSSPSNNFVNDNFISRFLILFYIKKPWIAMYIVYWPVGKSFALFEILAPRWSSISETINYQNFGPKF